MASPESPEQCNSLMISRAEVHRSAEPVPEPKKVLVKLEIESRDDEDEPPSPFPASRICYAYFEKVDSPVSPPFLASLLASPSLPPPRQLRSSSN